MREISSFRGVLGAPGAAVLVAQELRGGRFNGLRIFRRRFADIFMPWLWR